MQFCKLWMYDCPFHQFWIFGLFPTLFLKNSNRNGLIMYGEFKNEEKIQVCFSLGVIFDSLSIRELFLRSNRWCKFHEDLWPNALTDSLFVREGKNRVGCEVINSSKADYRVENISFCQKASFKLNYAIILLCLFWECWPKQYIKTHRKKIVRQLGALSKTT